VSWDECTVVFHDEGGDDTYDTPGFSLGSAAHSSFCLFLDDKGNDVYAQTPGSASDNSYHGGTSVALAIDSGGKDRYLDGKGADDRTGWRPEHAYFVDQPKPQTLPALLKLGNLFDPKKK
jgi:hypothetical protein